MSNLRVFDRAQYSMHVRGLIAVQLRQLLDIRRIGEPTPEWLAACHDVEEALCALERSPAQDELQAELPLEVGTNATNGTDERSAA